MQLLGELLSDVVILPDWLNERVDLIGVSRWWTVFQRLLITLFDGKNLACEIGTNSLLPHRERGEVK